MVKSDSAVVLRELGRRWERKSKQEKDASNEKEPKQDKDKEKADKPEKTGGDKWKAQHMDLAEKRYSNPTYVSELVIYFATVGEDFVEHMIL